MQSPACWDGKRYYYVDNKFYQFAPICKLGCQPTITKTKFKEEVFQISEIPETPYAPAKLGISDIEAGMVKYFNPIKHNDALEIAADVKQHFNLKESSVEILKLIERRFDSKFENIDLFLEQPLSFEVVLDLAIHDLQGSLRGNTSAGLGFDRDRKTLARTKREDFKALYQMDLHDFDIFWKLFLKDELRLKEKKTRSIAVGQLHLWFLTMKHLGGLYFYFKSMNLSWSAFGMNDTVETWTDKLGDWDESRVAYGYDIKNQDSKMSPGFARFLESFLKRHSPVSHWEGIEWYFEQAFYFKKIVDNKGYVLTFSQGEVSGDPLTILKNIMHNLFIHVVHEVVLDLLCLRDRKRVLIMGDDTLMQTDHADIFKQTALIIGHETTTETGQLYNSIEFLSMKIRRTKYGIACYYSNLDKMFASLVYTTGGTDEYFQKLCSFMNLLLFAPKNSLERKWYHKIDSHARYLMSTGVLTQASIKSYKTRDQLKRNRYGWRED